MGLSELPLHGHAGRGGKRNRLGLPVAGKRTGYQEFYLYAGLSVAKILASRKGWSITQRTNANRVPGSSPCQIHLFDSRLCHE